MYLGDDDKLSGVVNPMHRAMTRVPAQFRASVHASAIKPKSDTAEPDPHTQMLINQAFQNANLRRMPPIHAGPSIVKAVDRLLAEGSGLHGYEELGSFWDAAKKVMHAAHSIVEKPLKVSRQIIKKLPGPNWAKKPLMAPVLVTQKYVDFQKKADAKAVKTSMQVAKSKAGKVVIAAVAIYYGAPYLSKALSVGGSTAKQAAIQYAEKRVAEGATRQQVGDELVTMQQKAAPGKPMPDWLTAITGDSSTAQNIYKAAAPTVKKIAMQKAQEAVAKQLAPQPQQAPQPTYYQPSMPPQLAPQVQPPTQTPAAKPATPSWLLPAATGLITVLSLLRK